MDEGSASNFNLRNYIKEVWNVIQHPILLSEEYKLYLLVSPLYLSLEPFQLTGNEIKGKILLKSRIDAIIGEKPSLGNNSSVPLFKFTEPSGNESRIHLITMISYSEAQNLARKYFVGAHYNFEKRTLTIKDIELFGDHEKLGIRLHVSGDYSGIIFMTGRPVYNKADNQIKMENLELELNTQNVIHQSLGWLFKKRLIRQFQKALKFPLHDSFEEIKILVDNTLRDYILNENIRLNGQLKKIEIQHVYFKKEYIEVLFILNGNLNLEIKKIG